jgi:hypothetical protein
MATATIDESFIAKQVMSALTEVEQVSDLFASIGKTVLDVSVGNTHATVEDLRSVAFQLRGAVVNCTMLLTRVDAAAGMLDALAVLRAAFEANKNSEEDGES